MRQPKGGVPDPEWDPTDLMLVVVPIYGQRDAGRTFWKIFRGGMMESGMEENTFILALYFVAKKLDRPDGLWSYDVIMMMVTCSILIILIIIIISSVTWVRAWNFSDLN